MRRTRVFRLFNSMGLAAIFTIYIFILVPLTIYTGNINEFTTSYSAIVKIYIPAMVFSIAAFGLLGMLLPVRSYSAYTTLLATIGILVWVQSSLLIWDYGLLDGRAIDWSSNKWQGWLEMAIWSGTITLALTFKNYIGQRIIVTATLLFILQTFLFTYNWINHSSELAKKSESAYTNQSTDNVFQFSSHKNVLHIIADGFQSDIFEDIISDEEQGSNISTALDGFTFYREQMGAFPYTHMSIPAILSGKIYRNQTPINEFMKSTLGNKSILNVAYDSGYDVDLIVPDGLLVNIYKNNQYTNIYAAPNKIHKSNTKNDTNSAAKLLDLSLFRSSPHFLKKIIYNDQLWLVQSILTDEKFKGLQFFAHKDILRNFHENISVNRQKPVYKYIHLMLSHTPMVTNKQCEYAGRVLLTSRENVKTQARCGLIEILELFKEMKKAGIYNDALIIVMADHGAWVAPSGLKGVPNNDGKTMEVINPRVMALAQPLLAIKRPGETGALRISNAPSSIIDTAATITDALGLDAKFDGLSVFGLEQNDKRKRRHFVYQYKRSDWKDQFLSPIQEFIIDGKGVDSASWREVAIHLPGGETQKNQGKSSLWQTIKIKK